MVVEESNPAASTATCHPSGISQEKIDNIMSGISNTGTVKLNNHRKKLRQRFDIIKKLGQGTYGKVQLGINKETGQEVAIKTIKKCKIEAEADLIRIRREVQIMSSVQHPNIIHIYEVFENREKMVLVMEFAAGGELYDYLSDRKVLSEDEARRVFRQVSTAVYYCHKHKICHRDLKLENILLDENGNAKIADFGLSNVFDDRRLLATFCGSPLYASPEIVKGTPYQGPEVDCWSLGVLLYTLVYGSMPFDGSNFSRLVKQISQGDYYEPKKTSRASPLIRDMLTANPEKRADIEQICQHWWVNEGYKESCLQLAEALANQTPVRLDVLLSLSPMSVTADQLVVPSADSTKANDRVSRSHSVGSIRCVVNSEAERRILDMVAAGGEEALMPSPTRNLTPVSPNQIKRKIEVSASSENSTEIAKKKEKSMENNIAAEMETGETDLYHNFNKNNSSSNLNEEINQRTPVKIDNSNYTQATSQLQSVNENEIPSAETSPTKVIKKFVNKHKTADLISAINKISPEKRQDNVTQSQIMKSRQNSLPDETNKVNTERARLGLDVSEKFQRKNSSGKPKLNIVSGVNVSNFKKEFERRASIPSTNLDSKIVGNKDNGAEQSSVKNYNTVSSQKSLDESTSSENFSLAEARRSMENSIALLNEARNESSKSVDILCAKTENIAVTDIKNARERKLQNARDIIGNAIQPGVRKFSVSKHNYVIPELSTPLSYIHQPLREQTMSSSFKKPVFDGNKDNNIKTSKAEITLKSATLPRRKISKAEIKLEIQPPIIEQPMRFSTEMKHRLPDIRSAPVEDNSKSISSLLHQRATSVGPTIDENREHLITTQKPPMYTKQYFNPRRSGSNYPNTQSNINNSQLSSLGGTQPIKKSPREFIIPIAVEGGGYITPRCGSIEPSELNQTFGNTSFVRKSRLVSPFLTDVEPDENTSFQRSQTTSVSKEDDLEPRFSLHRLRSSRPIKKNSQDSQSSGEEEDDDGFEILTAENLFSTLLQRVRALTNRLNVNNDLTTGFPNSSRLLSNMRTTPFWNQGSFERRLNGSIGVPWRHSLSRDMGSDIESMFNRTATLPRDKEIAKSIKKKISRSIEKNTDAQVEKPIDLADLDLSRIHLSKKDFETLSSITPSLPTSFQQQLIAKLPPNHSRKLSRTLSMQNNMEDMNPSDVIRKIRRKNDNKNSSQNRKTQSLTNEIVCEELIDPNRNFDNFDTENNLKSRDLFGSGKGKIIKSSAVSKNNVKSMDKLPIRYLSPPPNTVRSKHSLENTNVPSKTISDYSLLKSNSVPKEVFSESKHKKSIEKFNNSIEGKEIIEQYEKNIKYTDEKSDTEKKKISIKNIILRELENLSPSISQKEIRNNEKSDTENILKINKKSKSSNKLLRSDSKNIDSKTKFNMDLDNSENDKLNLKDKTLKKTSKLKRPKSYPYKEIKSTTDFSTPSNSEISNFSDSNYLKTTQHATGGNGNIEIERTIQDTKNNITTEQSNDDSKTERTKSLNNINIQSEILNLPETQQISSDTLIPKNNALEKKSRKSLFLTLGKKIENLRKNSKIDESNSPSQLTNRKLKKENEGKGIPCAVKHSNISCSDRTQNIYPKDIENKILLDTVPHSTQKVNVNESSITESGLLKKAVSAGEINKSSVKKLLGLFKRFEKDSKEQKDLSTCSTSNIENYINKIPKKKNCSSAGRLFSKVKKSTDLNEISMEKYEKSDNLTRFKNKSVANVNEFEHSSDNSLKKNYYDDNADQYNDNDPLLISCNLKDHKKTNSYNFGRKYSLQNTSDINENYEKYHNNTLRPLSVYPNHNVDESPVDDTDLRFEDLLTYNPSPINLVSHLEFPSTNSDNQNETMMDRIKRRSFYCRFNDNKPKRQSNIVGAAAREYYRETEAKLRSRPQAKYSSIYATTARHTDSNRSKLFSINNGPNNSLESTGREYTTNEQRPISLHFIKSKQSIHDKPIIPHSSGLSQYSAPDWNYNLYNTTRNRSLLLNDKTTRPLLNDNATKSDSKSNVDSLGNITRSRQYEGRTLSSHNNSRLPLNSSSKHHLRSHSRDATRYLLPFSAIPRSPPNV